MKSDVVSQASRARTTGLLLLLCGTVLLACRPDWGPRPANAVAPVVSAIAPYPYPLNGMVDGATQIAFYEKRVKADPADASDEAMLARIYLHQAKMTNEPAWFMQAQKMAQESLEHQSVGNDNAEMVVARVLEAMHDFRGSLALCDKVMHEKKQEDAILVEVTCNLGLGHTDRAAAMAAELVGMESGLSTWSTMALVREDVGDEAGMHEAWRKAFRLEEPGDQYGSAWSRVLYGRYFFRHGRYTLADSLYREALRIFPQFPLGLQQMAELDTVLGRYDDAEAHYGQAYTLAPAASCLSGKGRVRALRGDAAGAADLRSKAEAFLRRDLRSSPLGHGRDLACLLLERGDPKDVPEALRIMQKDIANRRDWLTMDACAWALQASHQYAAALAIEQEALKAGIHSAQLRYRMAQIEEAMGRSKEATADYALALQADPSYRTAHAAVPFML